jgi:hypothetical protein
MRRPAAFTTLILLLLLSTGARAQSTGVIGQNGCPGGTYSTVNSPDGSTLSILFDNFSVTSAPGSGNPNRKFCNIQVSLNLPDGYTLGIYKVDYRGFSRLSAKQFSELFVDYALGIRNKSRSYHRKTKGPYEGDFLCTETIGAGLMKRVGCGEEAVLNVSAALELNTGLQPGEAIVALDSVDGAPKSGLIYHFDLKKCGQ